MDQPITPTTVLGVLQSVRTLLFDHSKWCSGNEARNAQGRSVSVDDPDAVSFCLLGAMVRVLNDPVVHARLYDDTYMALKDNIPDSSMLSAFNDQRGYQAVLALLDLTISKMGSS